MRTVWSWLLSCLLLLVLLMLGATPACAVSAQPGWPQTTAGEVHSSPALGDLDGDGDLEVVIGSEDNHVYAWHHDGSPVTGWPQATESAGGSPALGDLDGDGDPEVVAADLRPDGGGADTKVYAWHHDGVPVAGWPQSRGWGSYSSLPPVLGDLDGDGEVEVIVSSPEGVVYAWRHDGSPVAGWPQTGTTWSIAGTAALGDLDGDGNLEVVIGCGQSVQAWHHDGCPVAGWPLTPLTDDAANFRGSPALGDLDGDGDLEVVIGSYMAGTGAHPANKVYAWHHDGVPVAGWPPDPDLLHVVSSPALGDLDGDGDVEVVVGSGDITHLPGPVYAWHHDGSAVVGWPQATGDTVNSSPALGDLDGDGDLEVVVGSGDHSVYAWHHDGVPVAGWPQATGGWVFSSPALGDLEGDGDLEVVVGSGDSNVYAWGCDTPTSDSLPWPMFHHDLWHTGVYGATVQESGAGFVASPVVGPVPLLATFTDRSTANPSSWSWSFGDGASSTEQHPTHEYTAVGRYPVTLDVVTDLGPSWLTKSRCILVLFTDVLTDQWAWQQVMACVQVGIVKGYADNTYRPKGTVTRGQMAIYIARAVAGGDAFVPTGPATATFTDVPTTDSVFKYVEYAVAQGVVTGYTEPDLTKTYRPGGKLNRGQMAAFLARSMCGGESLVPPGPGTPSFPDVPADFAFYNHVEYILAHGVTTGYGDGTYRPAGSCLRDQMAVFVTRAFALPL